jgi:TnpA family transposase
MSIIKILEESQRKEFDKPPKLSYAQRKFIFALPQWAELEHKSMLDANKVGFTLQMGYFKLSGRFFKTETFYKEDILFIVRLLGLTGFDYSNFKDYYEFRVYPHRHINLINFGISGFGKKEKDFAYQEAIRLLKKQASPSKVFYSLATYLRSHRIEIPTYFALASVITDAFRQRDTLLISLIDKNLSGDIQKIFDKMLSIDENSSEKTYLLTQLKKSQELMKPTAIRANIADYKYLKVIYKQINPLLALMDISDEMIHYYAQFVIRSQVFQVSRRENRYLMLLCFVAYQYRFLGDLLIETFLRAAQQFENTAQRDVKETIYQNHIDNQISMEQLFELASQMADELTKVETITLDFGKTNDEKAKYWIGWVNSEVFLKFKNSKKEVEKLKKGAYIKKDDAYYQTISEKSRVLQYRVSDILRNVDFNCNNVSLKMALEEFKHKNGYVGEKFVDTFLKKQEKDILARSTSATSLYKVLLTQYISNGIKSGQVTLMDSFGYKAYENYLIDDKIWQKDKIELLQKTNSEWFLDWKIVKKELQESLTNAYERTFNRINKGQNTFVHKRKDGKPRFTEPTTEAAEFSMPLFPKEGQIPIIQVLHAVQEKCHFIDALQHFSTKNNRQKPDNSVFFAGILAYGCNIGVGAMARNAPNISASSLENTVNWYFSLENVRKANDMVISMMSKLKVGELFRKDPSVIHTSSDGQKFYVQVDSVHASSSFKYFGKEKGIVTLTFIDDMHRLFHSLTIMASEREALYVFEGLMQNDVVQSDMHSTDTHGTNGINFALLYLAKIRFIPRIEDFQNQNFYIFYEMEVPKLIDYDLKIGKSIDTSVIENNWDMLCRMMSTILTKQCSATTLVKRLGSYSQHHPVYQALKELDKIVKTISLLNYMDDETIRQIVQKQLNKGENANKFARAVFYGNSGEIRFSSREEKLLADACKRLIQNIIIAWNYLYLTDLVLKIPTQERKKLIQVIQESSPVQWEHINLHGTFDFSKEALKDFLDFDMEELMNFDWNE